jgi:hypothetical protein
MTINGVGFYREAWLVIAQGGWWKLREVLENMPRDCETGDPYNRFWIMENRHGYVVSRGEGKDREYAVRVECVIPYGIPVARLMTALGVGDLGKKDEEGRAD